MDVDDDDDDDGDDGDLEEDSDYDPQDGMLSFSLYFFSILALSKFMFHFVLIFHFLSLHSIRKNVIRLVVGTADNTH